MHRRPTLLLLFTLILFPAFSLKLHASGIARKTTSGKICVVTGKDSIPAVKDTSKPKSVYIKPILGLGTGMMSFWGDYNENHVANPQYGRLGYEMSLSQKLTPYLQGSLYLLFGKLGANEHFGNTYCNFESTIRLGGFQVEYNFDNFFKNKERKLSPYVTLGIESFEFLSKTDMYDASGNKYYYWNDGTIRSMDQNAVGASKAVILQRDYQYTTDIRTLNANGFGKYPEQSYAIPIGIGVLFHLSKRMDFKVGTTFHYTFTDYIDGLPMSTLKGQTHADKFLYSSFMIRYDLTAPDTYEKKNPHQYDSVDFKGMLLADEDNDLVPDIRDSCPGTPTGVAVDLKGCPLDSDKDGVPDYLDKQVDSPAGAIVDKNGVAMSDTLISENWDRFEDSTMKYAEHVVLPMGGNGGYHPAGAKKEYTVLLGTFKKGLSTEKMSKYLSISDVRSTTLSDSSTAYSAGKFDDVLEAEKRKKELIADGNPDARVVYFKNGKFTDASSVFASDSKDGVAVKEGSGTKTGTGSKAGSETKTGTGSKTGSETKTGTKTVTDTKAGFSTGDVKSAPGVVLRVQLGAFHHRVSQNTFSDAGQVMEIPTDDGLFRYVTGSYSTFDAAAKGKVDMLSKGFQGAFIVAYKDGKRVSLTDVGAIPAPRKNPNDSDNVKTPAVKKELISFRVQVGVFKNDPPAEMKAKFQAIKDLKMSTTSSGLTRYTAGSFQTLEEAEKLKAELKQKGIDGVFIVAFFKDELISVQEAKELLKQ